MNCVSDSSFTVDSGVMWWRSFISTIVESIWWQIWNISIWKSNSDVSVHDQAVTQQRSRWWLLSCLRRQTHIYPRLFDLIRLPIHWKEKPSSIKHHYPEGAPLLIQFSAQLHNGDSWRRHMLTCLSWLICRCHSLISCWQNPLSCKSVKHKNNSLCHCVKLDSEFFLFHTTQY